MAGGTGGHVYPALAVAEELQRMGAEILWLGTLRGIEARVVPTAEIDIAYIAVSGLRGKGVLTLLLAPFRLAFALMQAIRVVMRFRPGAVLGMGGFVSGPGGIATWLLRKPLLIHEQNAVCGLTNRILSRLATCVMEAFPGSFPRNINTVVVGNPVRRSIREIAEPQQRLADRSGVLRVLVIGGSQGAHMLNNAVPGALRLLDSGVRPEVWHQSGEKNLEDTRAAYTAAGVNARIVPYIDDIKEAYQWADLVICRAGALTVAELASAGIASILIPFPHAVDDHQTANAMWLVEAGAAIHMQESICTPDRLGGLLGDLHKARPRLLEMAVAARKIAVPDADRQIAARCLEAAA